MGVGTTVYPISEFGRSVWSGVTADTECCQVGSGVCSNVQLAWARGAVLSGRVICYCNGRAIVRVLWCTSRAEPQHEQGTDRGRVQVPNDLSRSTRAVLLRIQCR